MSILSFIRKVCVQDAVYWAPGADDGFGEKTWTASAIKVRWDGVTKTVVNRFGKEVVSSASVMVQSALNVEGYLYLGTLTGLSAQQQANPKLVHGAYPIQRFEETPLFRSATKFVYLAYL